MGENIEYLHFTHNPDSITTQQLKLSTNQYQVNPLQHFFTYTAGVSFLPVNCMIWVQTKIVAEFPEGLSDTEFNIRKITIGITVKNERNVYGWM